jgi:diguanylate cyclase (GGDEF)-like protein/PAS domain S-box-containing protein
MRREHQLIAETPISLAALTRHAVEPDEAEWFARCRGDFLRSFPASLFECTRYGILLCVLAIAAPPAFAWFGVVACLAAVLGQNLLLRMEIAGQTDERTALARRAGLIAFRGIAWAAALTWAAMIAPPETRSVLTGLLISTMVVASISAITLPWLAVGLALIQAGAFYAGLALATAKLANPTLAVLLMTATFLHWSIFNLYYMFATRRIRTKRLAQSNETIQLVLNQYDDEGSDWLYEIGEDGRILNPSPRFCAAAGLEATEMSGMPLSSLVRGDGSGELQKRLQVREPFRALPVSLVVDGEERWWAISGRPVTAKNNAFAGWRGFIADITEARNAAAQVAWMAHYDALTGLANRSLLQSHLERRLAHHPDGARLALLYIDLDGFKEINDALGHDAGDVVLSEVARRLQNLVRPRDFVARLGGDEFVIVADDAGEASARAMVDRILASVAEPMQIDGRHAQVGASVGIALAPQHATSANDLLQAGDVAMYKAKTSGRQCYAVFHPDMQTHRRERRQLELDLRNAVHEGQLELHYQPLLDLTTGETTGYEALLRWQHPELGLIQPSGFIELAEETGIIVEIGRWVIRTALADAATWPETYSVAVNVSPAQMRDPHLVPTIVAALASSGVAPQRLEVEITENLLLRDTDEVMAILNQLRQIGVRIALDDFGTGYSSLNYLRSFPFDKIKIDRCFIAELATREDCQAIVRSVLSLASELHMVTTAEGVEALDQLDALRASGCDQAQGYLFSHALPAAQLGLPRPEQMSAGPLATISSPVEEKPRCSRKMIRRTGVDCH